MGKADDSSTDNRDIILQELAPVRREANNSSLPFPLNKVHYAERLHDQRRVQCHGLATRLSLH
jgi:hypothetical protein